MLIIVILHEPGIKRWSDMEILVGTGDGSLFFILLLVYSFMSIWNHIILYVIT